MGMFAISANSFTCQNLDLGSMTTSHPLRWQIKTICCTAGCFGEEGIRIIPVLHNHSLCDPPHSMNSVQEVSSKERIWHVQRVIWRLTLVLRICQFCPSRSWQRTWQGNLRDMKLHVMRRKTGLLAVAVVVDLVHLPWQLLPKGTLGEALIGHWKEIQSGDMKWIRAPPSKVILGGAHHRSPPGCAAQTNSIMRRNIAMMTMSDSTST